MTGRTLPDACHIYPYCLLRKQKADLRRKFWDILETFWSKDQIKTWQNELFSNPDGNGKETATNIICLSKDAHAYWNKGYFAIQPTFLSPDKKKLIITFFWQAKFKGDSDENVNLQIQPPSTRDLLDNGEQGTCLTTVSNLHLIKSGERFVLTTDDPVKLPLPSFELLRLQFFLQRVSGMAGAAEPLDLEGWSDDDAAGDAADIEDAEEWEEESEEDSEVAEPDVAESDVSPLKLGVADVPDLSFADTSLTSDESLLESPAKVVHSAAVLAAVPSAERPKHEGEREHQGEGEAEREEGLVQP